MFKVHTDEVQGYKQITVPYTLISKPTTSRNLAILLPGSGYTVQSPLLHYATGIFINKSFDVLHINYQYKHKVYNNFSPEEISKAVKHDVKTVIDTVLDHASYENFYLVGKSLGTIAMSSELRRDIFKEAKAVWLTPLLQKDEVFNALVNSNHSGLCFIGDNDHYYTEERYNQIQNNANIISKLIPNVNHKLEFDTDVLYSIDVLKDIMSEIEQF